MYVLTPKKEEAIKEVNFRISFNDEYYAVMCNYLRLSVVQLVKDLLK